ncbi:hypothetical protein Syun_004172 [Stephania yunnanensis]|uniref:Uncharacterized protein n=1 Tax=Stephania yunnanensis TaxID=152371 RepID=A0AAP0Q176_9MAGN
MGVRPNKRSRRQMTLTARTASSSSSSIGGGKARRAAAASSAERLGMAWSNGAVAKLECSMRASNISAGDVCQPLNSMTRGNGLTSTIRRGDSPRGGMGKETRKTLEHALGNHAKVKPMDEPWCRPPAGGTRTNGALASIQGA